MTKIKFDFDTEDIIQRWRKLTRKLSLVDYLLMAIFLIIGFVLIYIRFSQQTQWQYIRIKLANSEWWWEGDLPDLYYVSNLQVGQTSYNYLGQENAELVAINDVDVSGTERLVFLDIKLKTTYNPRKQILMHDSKSLLMGNVVTFTFGHTAVQGLVSYIGSEPPPFEIKQVELLVKGVTPEVANSFEIDAELRDSDGDLVNKLLEVSIEDSRVFKLTDIYHQELVIQTVNQLNKDVRLKVEVKGFTDGQSFYHINGAAVRIGSTIWLQFSDFEIQDAEIINFLN